MEIKSIVKNLAGVKAKERSLFIEDFLSDNNISYRLLNYPDGKNIEVIKEGINKKKEIIFFSHYDISNDTKEGANDNSSSVAIMLCIAKYLNAHETPFTIKLVFNDNEEILGALLNKEINLNVFKSQQIIYKIGSFQYLKNYFNKENILGIFNMELSGIGNRIFFATSSGAVNCSDKLIKFLCNLAEKNKINHIKIPFLSSDMISIHTLGMPGIVLGAIPGYEGEKYIKNSTSHKDSNYFPSIWKNIHSNKDNYFTIQEKSLNMIYDFILLIINNSKKLIEI